MSANDVYGNVGSLLALFRTKKENVLSNKKTTETTNRKAKSTLNCHNT